MKQLLNISSVGRIIVFFEIIMCAVCSLSVCMVNGADAITEDHLALAVLIFVTIASIIMAKSKSHKLNKAVLWIAVLPLLFICYQATATFFIPYEAQSLQHNANNSMLVILPSVR